MNCSSAFMGSNTQTEAPNKSPASTCRQNTKRRRLGVWNTDTCLNNSDLTSAEKWNARSGHAFRCSFCEKNLCKPVNGKKNVEQNAKPFGRQQAHQTSQLNYKFLPTNEILTLSRQDLIFPVATFFIELVNWRKLRAKAKKLDQFL